MFGTLDLRGALPSLWPAAETLGLVLLALTLTAAVLIFRRGAAARPATAAAPDPELAGMQSRLARSDANALPEAERGLAAIGRVQFELRPLLSRGKSRLLPFLERAIRDLGRGHRLIAQASLGDVLRPMPGSASPDTCARARSALEACRADFAILDRGGKLAAVVCYSERDQKDGRDPVLQETARRAGIPMIEFPFDWTPEQVKARIRHALMPPAPRVEPRLTLKL